MNKKYRSSAFIAIVIFIFLVGVFFYMEYSRHQALVIQEETNETERLLYDLQNYIEDMKDHLLLVANIWKRLSLREQGDHFLEMAEEMMDLYQAFRFIHFIDRDLVIRYSVPQEEALSIGLIGKDTSQDSETIKMFGKMMETHQPLISPIIWREVSKAYSAHIWVPILEGNDLLGIISGDLDLIYIIYQKIMAIGISHHSIRVRVNNVEIFRTDERQTYPIEVTHDIMDIPWTIGVYIDDTMSPTVIFLSGVLLSLLVSLSAYRMFMKNRLLEEAKDELQDREENLSVTLKSIGDGMIATDIKGHITRMNPAAEHLTGWLLKESLDRRIEEVFQIFNAKTGEPVVNPVQQVLEKGRVVGLANDTSLIRRDGTHLQISDSAAPIKDSQDKMKGVVLVFSDVTEIYRSQQLIKESEKKYRKSEERFQRMLSLVPDMISIHDPEMNIIYSNWRGFGKVIEEKRLLNTKCYRTYRGLETICPDCQAITVLETKKSFQKEMELPEGIWIDLRVIPLLGEDGSVEFFIEWVRDITKRKQMEEKLRKSEEKHRRLFETMAMGVIYQDADSKIISANKAAERILGLSFQEMQGKTSMDPRWQMIKEDGSPVFGTEHPAMIALRTGKIVGPVVRGIFHPDKNSHIWLNIIAIPLFQPGETEPFQVYAILEDITEEKKMEEKIQYQHDFQKLVANISYNFINTPSSWIHETINSTLHQIGTFFHVDRSYLFQFSSDDKTTSNTHEWCREGIEPQKNIIQNQPVEELPWITKEIRSKKYVYIPNVNALDYEEERGEFQRQGIQSLICIPIKVIDRVIGFIGMDAVMNKKVWADEEITLLKVIGEIMSSAFSKHQMEQKLIEHSQHVEQLNQHLNKEIEKAHRIHSNILPKKLPNIKGISFATFYQPADILGGDFYDVIQVDNKLVIYLSDISGHGLDASMINFIVKEAIDSYIALHQEHLSPRNILRHLERQFRQKNHPDEMFISVFLAVLDLETLELTYTGAGFQDAPLVKQGHGEQTELITKGLFINSIFPVDKNNFQEKTISLNKGSTIFFNTDGLTEQGKPGTFFRERLPQVFYKNAYLPPDGISQTLLEDFRLFNHGSLQGDDDITFLILQVEPDNRRYQFQLATDFGELDDIREKAVEKLPDLVETDVLISCLYELIANAMEHGNQMDPKKRVFLEVIVTHEYMQVTVEDEGEGFNWCDRVGKSVELEGHTERGRGISMVGILCDNLYYNDKGNKVTCIVKTT